MPVTKRPTVRIAFATFSSRKVVPLGMLHVASALRADGHQVFWHEASSTRQIVDAFRRDPVDVVGFGVTTGMHHVYLDWARAIKRHTRARTIFGGPHPTFVPSIIEHPSVDGAVIGEAEETIVQLVRALCEGSDRVVPGASYKSRQNGGPIIRGPVRPPPADLDALPAPAFDLIYDHHRDRARFPVKSFLASRGCAYRCSYCASAGYHALYGSHVKSLRLRSPAAVIEEIRNVDRKWGVGLIWLADASLLTNAAWAEELAARIRSDVRKPFFCKVRPDHVNASTAEMLARNGCSSVGLGVESGDDQVRTKVLGRAITRDQIVSACALLKQAGIRVVTFSMVGIPSETFDDALKTVDLNVACRPDYAEAMLLQPYPGTPLAAWAQSHGWFDGDFDRIGYSYLWSSPFCYQSPELRDRIERLQKLLGLAVEFPEVRAALPWLTRMPTQRLHDALFRVWYALGFNQRIHGRLS